MLIQAQMKMEAGLEDFKTEYDKKKLEKYIDGNLEYLEDIYVTINFLLEEAEVTTLETIEALDIYKEKYLGEE